MIRLIKRYGSRKLYDTEESRYVSLEELAAWIRSGQQIRVIDNKSSDDVTPQTLTRSSPRGGRARHCQRPAPDHQDREEAVSTASATAHSVDRCAGFIDRIGPAAGRRGDGWLRERRVVARRLRGAARATSEKRVRLTGGGPDSEVNQLIVTAALSGRGRADARTTG
jgi:hypothetical protein